MCARFAGRLRSLSRRPESRLQRFWYPGRKRCKPGLPHPRSGACYRYSTSGQRIYKKTGSATAEHYVQDGAVTIRVEKEDGTGTWNLIAGGEVVGQGVASGARYYYKDHLGSVRAVINTSGTVLESRDYYPFGSRCTPTFKLLYEESLISSAPD